MRPTWDEVARNTTAWIVGGPTRETRVPTRGIVCHFSLLACSCPPSREDEKALAQTAPREQIGSAVRLTEKADRREMHGFAVPLGSARLMENLRILCVEPDADIRVVIDLSLGLDPSIDARIVGHVSDARKALDDGAWAPDCIVLETIKPGAIGARVYDAIRSHPRYSAVKVVVLTGAVDQNSMASYATLGAWGVISKPFDPLMLAEQIRSSIGDHKQLAT